MQLALWVLWKAVPTSETPKANDQVQIIWILHWGIGLLQVWLGSFDVCGWALFVNCSFIWISYLYVICSTFSASSDSPANNVFVLLISGKQSVHKWSPQTQILSVKLDQCVLCMFCSPDFRQEVWFAIAISSKQILGILQKALRYGSYGIVTRLRF